MGKVYRESIKTPVHELYTSAAQSNHVVCVCVGGGGGGVVGTSLHAGYKYD